MCRPCSNTGPAGWTLLALMIGTGLVALMALTRSGIRHFWAAQRFRIAGWDELQAAFESASGEKLGAFFAAWLDQPALPDVAIAHAESTAVRTPGSPPYQLTIRFRKQDARLPLRLPIEISGAGQREAGDEQGASLHGGVLFLNKTGRWRLMGKRYSRF